VLVDFLFLAGLGVREMAATLPVLVLPMARLGRADRASAGTAAAS